MNIKIKDEHNKDNLEIIDIVKGNHSNRDKDHKDKDHKDNKDKDKKVVNKEIKDVKDGKIKDGSVIKDNHENKKMPDLLTTDYGAPEEKHCH